MSITIAERLRPFSSHCPGATCLLPHSTLALQIFPALIRIFDMLTSRPTLLGEVVLPIEGPVHPFTILQDLESGEVRVFGQSRGGYFQYSCRAVESGKKISLQVKKGTFAIQNTPPIVTLEPSQPNFFPPKERLSLGSHKAQDWTLIKRRQNLEEILPIWFYLAQQVPPQASQAYEGTALLLNECSKAITAKQKVDILSAFEKLFRAGFHEMLVPRLEDEQHQGFSLPNLKPTSTLSPLTLLTDGATLIRTLFIQQQEAQVEILPALPPQFHSGRMTAIHCPNFGHLDLEWSKKELRRLSIQAESSGELQLLFQPSLKKYRLRRRDGNVWHILQSQLLTDTPFVFEKGVHYLFDNFQH